MIPIPSPSEIPLLTLLFWPLLIPLINIFAGFKISLKDKKQVSRYLVVFAVESIICTVILLWTLGGICSIDDGPRCNPGIKWYVIVSGGLFIAGVILMFLGILLKKIFQIIFKSRK